MNISANDDHIIISNRDEYMIISIISNEINQYEISEIKSGQA